MAPYVIASSSAFCQNDGYLAESGAESDEIGNVPLFPHLPKLDHPFERATAVYSSQLRML